MTVVDLIISFPPISFLLQVCILRKQEGTTPLNVCPFVCWGGGLCTVGLLQGSLEWGKQEEILIHRELPRCKASSPLSCALCSGIPGASDSSSPFPMNFPCLLRELWKEKCILLEAGLITCSVSRMEAELVPSLFGCCGASLASHEGSFSFSPIRSLLISSPLAEPHLPES